MKVYNGYIVGEDVLPQDVVTGSGIILQNQSSYGINKGALRVVTHDKSLTDITIDSVVLYNIKASHVITIDNKTYILVNYKDIYLMI